MDKRSGKKPADYFRREEAAIRLDVGPYIGKIKNNVDPIRSGRLQVYIPDLSSGDEDLPENWRTIAYASPFFGSTTQPDTNKQNSFSKVRHTYGMWAVAPDLGNFVLCTFVAGDPNRGFWFACIPNQLGHHMVPGIAGSYNVDASNIENSTVKQNYQQGTPTVVAEFNENDETIDWANFTNLKKPIHEEYLKTLINQGLDNDYLRGIISSSSQRESPSYVFGISTPGRPVGEPTLQPGYKDKLISGDLKEGEYAVAARKGGHSFIMDDGNWEDKDQLIRLRTAGGHQILMNDSERILYVGNSDGSVWIELTGPGHLNIYTGASVNIRAAGDLNLHADKDINLNAGNKVNISGSKGVNIQSTDINVNSTQTTTIFGGTVGIGSAGIMNFTATGAVGINSNADLKLTGKKITLNDGGTGVTVSRPVPLTSNSLSDTGKTSSGAWRSVAGALKSIVPIAPTHEPWSLHANSKLVAPLTASPKKPNETTNGVTTGASPSKALPIVDCNNTSSGPASGAGPQSAQNQGVNNPVSGSAMNKVGNPDPTAGVGPLTATQTKALMTQMGWNESGSNYSASNQYNYLGKYQTGAAVLSDQGYIKRDAYALYGNKAVNYPTSWTGKDGVTSRESYLTNGPVQEKIMEANLNNNYNTLLKTSALQAGDDQCTVAGMLAASHLLGAGGAKTWRNSGGGADANGTTGTSYYNMGRYAVDVLAASAGPKKG